MTMAPSPTDRPLFDPIPITPPGATLGEGPRWHPAERRLYWVDIAANALHRTDPVSGTTDTRTFGDPVACFAFRAAGGMVLGMKDGCALIDGWDADPVPFGPQVLADKPHHRMNDGRTDPAGRFWVGSVNSAKDAHDATLYRLDPDGALHTIESGMLTCNGAAFTGDGRRFAHADTPSHRLRQYRVENTGELTDSRTLYSFPHGQGRPDGGSFDVEGQYWSALFDGGRVVRIDADGQITRAVPLPVSRPTMIAFGGPDLCTAFVTTATTGLSDAERAAQPLAGAVFAFRVDVPGVPEWPFGG